MTFIRTKKIKGNEYAYLVNNKWYKRAFQTKGKGSRQRVSKYLGKVYRPSKVNNVDFLSFKGIESVKQYLIHNQEEQIIKDLVLWELHRHNVDIQDFTVDFRGKKVRKGTKKVSIRMNEGFLNGFTLRRLFNLNSEESYYLAKCFVEAGIMIPKEVFVGLFVDD